MDVLNSIQKGDIAIDCGANMGNITEKMVQRGAFVYAFEPNPVAFEFLKNRFINNINVVCINKGVGVKNLKQRLYLHKEYKENPILYSESSSIFPSKRNVDAHNYVVIEIIDFVQFIHQHIKPEIRLLKIDIEGAEYDLLMKLIRNNLHTKFEKIIVETHADRIPGLQMKERNLKGLIRNRKIDNIRLDWY